MREPPRMGSLLCPAFHLLQHEHCARLHLLRNPYVKKIQFRYHGRSILLLTCGLRFYVLGVVPAQRSLLHHLWCTSIIHSGVMSMVDLSGNSCQSLLVHGV